MLSPQALAVWATAGQLCLQHNLHAALGILCLGKDRFHSHVDPVHRSSWGTKQQNESVKAVVTVYYAHKLAIIGQQTDTPQ